MFINSCLSLVSGKQAVRGICRLATLLVCCAANVTFAASFEYLNLAGANFHPQRSDVDYEDGNRGCIYKTGGANNTNFIHKVELPDRAEVKYVRIYSYDDAGSRVKAFLTSYDGTSVLDHTNIASTNDGSSFKFDLSPRISYFVDNRSESLNVVVNLGTADSSSLKFCGVRIAYYAPPPELIFEDSFE